MASEWDSFSTGLKERLLLIAAQVVVMTILAGVLYIVMSN